MSGETKIAAKPASSGWNSTKFGNYSQVASAVIASLALTGAAYQIATIRSNTRETAARQMFRSYLDLAFNNPKFSSPDYDALKKNTVDLERYGWFVDNLLFTCEEVVAAFSSDKTWRATCEEHVGYHLRYICDAGVKDQVTHDPEIAALIKQVIAHSDLTSAPECKANKV
ncbi:MAG TPA: hypothetical protein VFB45_13460 [Pseudolabrys sp.]|nr:hypothetical protein [Pseudolabrys sp.]